MTRAALMFFVSVLAAHAADPAPRPPDPARGRELFQTCAGCHDYATGEKKFGPSLRTLFGRVTLRNGKPATDENVRAIILDGYNRMPPFRYSFRPAEIDDLMAFLHTLNARPLESVSASPGEKYFRAYCLRCHANNLGGVGSRAGMTDAKLRSLIDDGHAGSPALKDWLDEPTRAAILAYVKKL